MLIAFKTDDPRPAVQGVSGLTSICVNLRLSALDLVPLADPDRRR
jgi:hypothetical protein